MNRQRVWRRDAGGGKSEKIKDHCFGIIFCFELRLQLNPGEKNG